MRKLNLNHKKIVAVATAAVVAGSSLGIGINAYAGTPNKEEIKKDVTETLSSVITTEKTSDKEETVYVITDASGNATKIISSNWLKNNGDTATLTDAAILDNIINVKGDESFTTTDGTQVWNANGNDIYYQGTSDRQLPVDVKITYTLNGVEITPADLAGKSGAVTIRFDYSNNEKREYKIDQKKENIYVPFLAVTGTILDNEIFSNVEVVNGKLINDGDRSVVIGFAFSGLNENLAVKGVETKLPDYVEIKADVTDFALATTVTMTTNEVFNFLSFDEIDNAGSLTAALDKLADAAEQLEKGSATLYEGLCTLYEKSGELADGVSQLYDGSTVLKDGTTTLYGGTQALNAGAQELNTGLNTLVGNNAALNAGATQVFESLLSVANTQLAAAGLDVPELTIENYNKTLSMVLTTLSEENVTALANRTAKEKVTQAVNANKALIEAQVTMGVRAKVTEAVLAAAGQPMSAEDYANAVAAGMIPEAVQAQVAAMVDAQMETAEVKAQIAAVTEEQVAKQIELAMNSEEVQTQLKTAIATAAAGRESIQGLINQLDSYKTFYTGLNMYTAGVAAAAQGAGQLCAGTNELMAGAEKLSAGAGQLNDGLATLNDSVPALIDGVEQLRDGSKQLADGLAELNEQGVQKLINAVEGDISTLIERMKATIDASQSYESYSGIADGLNGNVKFIYRTGAIE